jgi:hypothetical protein
LRIGVNGAFDEKIADLETLIAVAAEAGASLGTTA